MKLKAEVIAIGDEITCGQCLDTNSQWLSQRLGDLGIQVAFHTTVGDELQDNVEVFRVAAQRADIILSTGGLGPTADDLTRQAIAEFADVELELNSAVVTQIREIFKRYNYEMPDNNLVQAYFPVGSSVIANPEGTAPGIDFPVRVGAEANSRIFALPGVPAEMKQMWDASVEPAIRTLSGETRFIHHHVLHCFGVGESHAATLLPDMIRRGREPRVGITASGATISFRISATGDSEKDCIEKMQPTIQEIRNAMGELVYGENGQELETVVVDELLRASQTVAVVDLGLRGDVVRKLVAANTPRLNDYFKGGLVLSEQATRNWLPTDGYVSLSAMACKMCEDFDADIGIAIGPIRPTNAEHFDRYELTIESQAKSLKTDMPYGGHSSLRQTRSVKQVLNQLRIFLK